MQAAAWGRQPSPEPTAASPKPVAKCLGSSGHWKSRCQGNTSCHAIPPISTCFNMFQLAFTNSDNFNIFEWAFTTSAQRWEPSGSPHSVFNSVYKLLFSNILNISQHIITVILSWWQHNYKPSQTSSKLRTNHIWLWLIVAPRSPAGQRSSQRSSRRLSDWEVRSYLGSLLLHGSLLYMICSQMFWHEMTLEKVDTLRRWSSLRCDVWTIWELVL